VSHKLRTEQIKLLHCQTTTAVNHGSKKRFDAFIGDGGNCSPLGLPDGRYFTGLVGILLLI